MKYFFVIILLLSSSISVNGTEPYFLADFRHRPPEMTLDGGSMTGPLKDILEEAAQNIGCSIRWRSAHFARSLKNLQEGEIDILPRMVRTDEREKYTRYLGPIGYQKKDILFLVKRGQENLITTYDDLKNLRIEVKRGTAYFKRFDHDSSLKKHENNDDDNMVQMFKAGRFDTMPVLDQQSLESALSKYNITDYSYAKYKHINRIGNYFGMSKKSKKSGLFEKLNASLLQMVESGRIGAIYEKYGLLPPATE